MTRLFTRSSSHAAVPTRCVLIALLLTVSATAAEQVTPTSQLKGLTLEQLLNLKVILASRTPEEWKSVPAAIGVLSADDVRRSGAVRLAEVLQMAPGLDVARYVGSSYAISARGFNATSSNKMQVMLDGRSLYTPLFSGVFWEIQDTFLEDLDRVEVVRGPGAALWGSNAVNGVINLMSKNARDTQGALVTGGGGDEERAFGGVRYGGKLGETTYYRVYCKYLERDDQIFANGTPARDGMEQTQTGFRLDSVLAENNSLTFQGDLYRNQFGVAGRPDAMNDGGNLLGRWTHTFSPDRMFQVQAYYDRGNRDVPLQFQENRTTYDIDVQHHFKIGRRNEIVIGGNYRRSSDRTAQSGRTFVFVPPSRALELGGGFVQDRVTLMPDKLSLQLGSKFEHNDFTGWETQPTVRLAWTPTHRQVVWTAVSRAVRAPTRSDSDSRFLPVPSSGLVTLSGNPDFESEDLLAYEAGYRVEALDRLFVDVALFRNHYDHLRSFEPQPPLGFPLLISNEREGETSGGELALTYQATAWWRLTGSYSYLHENLRLKPGSRDPTNGTLEGNDPTHLATLRSTCDLPGGVGFDCAWRYVSALPNPRLPAYLELDVRIAVQLRRDWEIALVGRNLLDPHHPEFAGGGATQPEVQRSIYGQITFRH